MSIAVAVLLFILAFAFLCLSFAADGWKKWLAAFFLAVVCAAAGVLNIVTDLAVVRVAVGALLCIHAAGAFSLFVGVLRETRGPGDGLAVAASIGAFVLFAWITTFAVLQLTIVV